MILLNLLIYVIVNRILLMYVTMNDEELNFEYINILNIMKGQ